MMEFRATAAVSLLRRACDELFFFGRVSESEECESENGGE